MYLSPRLQAGVAIVLPIPYRSLLPHTHHHRRGHTLGVGQAH